MDAHSHKETHDSEVGKTKNHWCKIHKKLISICIKNNEIPSHSNQVKKDAFLYTNNKRSEREIGKQSPGEENGNLLQSSVWKRFIPRITV